MQRRVLRLGMVLSALVGLSALPPPAAEATSVFTLWHRGNMIISGGNNTIAYPCVGGLPGFPTVDASLCTPGTVALTPAPQPKHPFDVMPHVDTAHNPSSVAFGTKTCVGGGVNVNKLTKTFVDAALCAFSASGTIWGHCGAATGVVSGVIATPTTVYNTVITFTELQQKVLWQGTVFLANSPDFGWVRGLGTIHIESSNGSSCTNKHPLSFITQGALVLLLVTTSSPG